MPTTYPVTLPPVPADPEDEAIDVARRPSPDTADDCLADSTACVRQLPQWRAENQTKGPVQD